MMEDNTHHSGNCAPNRRICERKFVTSKGFLTEHKIFEEKHAI